MPGTARHCSQWTAAGVNNLHWLCLSLCPQRVDLCIYPEQIASKVELHVGLQSGEGISWKRLGSFAFDSNDRSKLQARELKSVTVSVQALFIRIVLARCHLNSQNIYKQVPSRWSLCAPTSAETGI